MSLTVGIDLVDVAQIEESLALYGDRFLNRVFTPAEYVDCKGHTAALAARFAAKEATMKALRRGDEGIGWQSIEVLTGAGGMPEIGLSGAAEELAATHGVTALRVSMTRQRRHAAAVVVAEAAR
jgi:holo-[acyl-carrier protein] synthase